MNRNVILSVLLIAAAVGLSLAFRAGISVGTDNGAHLASSPLNATYKINDQIVSLLQGHAEEGGEADANSRTQVIRDPVFGDLDGDGDDDAALILKHDSLEGAQSYYGVAAVAIEGGYSGTNAVFLGDSLVPQEARIQDGIIVIGLATGAEAHSPGDVEGGREKYLRLVDGTLIEAAGPQAASEICTAKLATMGWHSSIARCIPESAG